MELNRTNLTVTCLLSACGSLVATKLGEQIHALIYKLGFNDCIFVNNYLITMYFKCCCEDGLGVFKEMTEQDIVAKNAVLVGCAQNELGKEAIKIFERMESRGLSPNEISFLGLFLLCACSHAGFLHEQRLWDHPIHSSLHLYGRSSGPSWARQ